MENPIAIALSPNTEKDDIFLALRLLFSPQLWFDSTKTEEFEKIFARKFGRGYLALAVNSGRSALYLILKALGVKGNDEVALQALTCVAVPNAILWLGAKPLYIDVDENFNMDIRDMREKVSEKTKTIIVQHTFGIPANMKEILKFSKEKKIPLVEDCALCLGGSFNGRLLGTFGKVSFFSFGRDKVISSVFGGMILTKDKDLYQQLKKERDKLNYPPRLWVFQQLLHPILINLLVLPFLNLGLGNITLGKIVLLILQKLGFLSKAVLKEEKFGKRPKIFPSKFPGALAQLAHNQFFKLERFNKKRKKIANLYFRSLKTSLFKLPRRDEGSVWVRFPVIYQNAPRIIECMKKKGILLGDWYKDVIVPVKDLAVVNYRVGFCPRAESLAGKILNLPTYQAMSKEKALYVTRLLKICVKSL